MRLFKKILLLIFSLLFIFLLLIFFMYRNWEQKTFSKDSGIVCFTDIDEATLNIDTKIEKFILSDSKTEFVTFTTEEVISVLKSNIQVGESAQVEDLCVLSSKGMWSVYLKYRLGKVPVPWIVLDIVKDDRETAEIYVKDLYIGGYLTPKIFSKKIIVEINKGISDAIILVNENSFLGRNIKNIELLEERVVIKGSL